MAVIYYNIHKIIFKLITNEKRENCYGTNKMPRMRERSI